MDITKHGFSHHGKRASGTVFAITNEGEMHWFELNSPDQKEYIMRVPGTYLAECKFVAYLPEDEFEFAEAELLIQKRDGQTIFAKLGETIQVIHDYGVNLGEVFV